MQSEEFDKKVSEAADHHHPAYDEQAWLKMEKLLDKHLPQKKDDRKRFIFFLCLFLLLGGGAATLFFTGNGRKNEQSSITDNRTTVQKPGPLTTGKNDPSANHENKNTNEDIGKKPPSGSNTLNNNTSPSHNSTTNSFDKISVKDFGKNKQTTNTPINVVGKTDQNTNTPLATNIDKSVSPDKLKNNLQVPGVLESGKINSNISGVINTAAGSMGKADKNVNQVVTNNTTTQINDPDKKENITVLQNPTEKPIKIRKTKKSSFSLNFSAGPDISVAGLGKPGKMNLFGGIGMGYTYKERFTLRTGFYEGNKVYTASPGDYHPPSRFYYYYPNLEKIDANCRVYEIPISLSYNFGHTKKQNWFVSSGVSSYLMKRETYNYFYKSSPTEPTISRKRTLQGVNKHYFSVLNLSAGYQKNLSKSVSLTIEPYLKLPLRGVGYGKVKLNSSGVMFTIGVKPFALFKK